MDRSDDSKKTREQLIAELEELRRRIGETERDGKADMSLQEGQFPHHSLIHDLQEGILVIDREYQITDVNNTMLKSIGSKRENVVGRHCYEISHRYSEPCSKFGEQCSLREVFETGHPANFHHVHFRDDGLRFDVDILMSPVKDQQGNITHVIEAVRDVSDLYKEQEALRESEGKYRELFNNVPVGTGWTRVSDGKLLECNDRFADLFGYENRDACVEEVVLGEQYVEPDLRNRMLDQLKTKGEVELFEAEFKREDGSRFWGSFSAYLYPERDIIEGALVDITERVRAEILQKAVFKINEAMVESRDLATMLVLVHEQLTELMDARNFFVALSNTSAEDGYTFPYFVDEKDASML